MIPAGQRATIEWTEWDEALSFQPPPTKAGSGHTEPLWKVLADIRWKDGPDGGHGNLLDYLVCPRLDRRDPSPADATTKKFREAYSGLQVLDATPRELLDLWMRLRRARSDETHSTMETHLPMLVERTLLAVEEQDFLTEEDQEILRFVFRQAPVTICNFAPRNSI